jgi:hypothetical protein
MCSSQSRTLSMVPFDIDLCSCGERRSHDDLSLSPFLTHRWENYLIDAIRPHINSIGQIYICYTAKIGQIDPSLLLNLRIGRLDGAVADMLTPRLSLETRSVVGVRVDVERALLKRGRSFSVPHGERERRPPISYDRFRRVVVIIPANALVDDGKAALFCLRRLRPFGSGSDMLSSSSSDGA